jgi:hypothetical protein
MRNRRATLKNGVQAECVFSNQTASSQFERERVRLASRRASSRSHCPKQSGAVPVMVREKGMPSVFGKLNLKDQQEILVLNAPESFERELATLKGVAVIRELKKARVTTFSLAFVITQKDLDSIAPTIARKAEGDSIVWFAYPKGTSKKFKSQINRDNGWKVLGAEGFEPVRMVAIDEDWSALRFRRVEFLKNMTRAKEHRLTEQAKGGRASVKSSESRTGVKPRSSKGTPAD